MANIGQNGKYRVIIISLPGVVQESIRAILEAMADVEVVGLASGGLSALALVKEEQPDVVVIDSNLTEDEVLAFLRDVRQLDLNVRLVVLTYTSRQKRRILGSGADVVVSRWSQADEFTDAILGTSKQEGPSAV